MFFKMFKSNNMFKYNKLCEMLYPKFLMRFECKCQVQDIFIPPRDILTYAPPTFWLSQFG